MIVGRHEAGAHGEPIIERALLVPELEETRDATGFDVRNGGEVAVELGRETRPVDDDAGGAKLPASQPNSFPVSTSSCGWNSPFTTAARRIPPCRLASSSTV